MEAIYSKIQETYLSVASELIETQEANILKEFESELGIFNDDDPSRFDTLKKKIFKDMKKKYLIEGTADPKDSGYSSGGGYRKNNFKSLDNGYDKYDSVKKTSYKEDSRGYNHSTTGTTRPASLSRKVPIDDDYRERILRGGTPSSSVKESSYKSNVDSYKPSYDNMYQGSYESKKATTDGKSQFYRGESIIADDTYKSSSRLYSDASEWEKTSATGTVYSKSTGAAANGLSGSSTMVYKAEVVDGYIQYIGSDGKLVRQPYNK
jgi:hypothetical protein